MELEQVTQICNMRTIILLAILGSAFAVPERKDRIVGGAPTTTEAYPYMANMQQHHLGLTWIQTCGGTLINNLYVLSAAHCFIFYPDVSEWRVNLGSPYRHRGGILYNVNRLQMHGDYSIWTDKSDIALVRLSTSVVYTDNIKAARIPGSNFNLADGTPVTVAGWGRLEYGGPRPEQLHHVEVNVINQDLCADRYAKLKAEPGNDHISDIDSSMLCAGILDKGGRDACQGDSGGPLSIVHPDGNIVVGVISLGHLCAEPLYPGVNARVSYHSDWIASNAV